MQVNPEDCPPEIYVTWSDPRMTDFENSEVKVYLSVNFKSNIDKNNKQIKFL